MTILINQTDKWLVKYTLNKRSITVEHETWSDVIRELTNNMDLIRNALISKSNTDNDK